jgi:hypothetical protein
MKIGVWLVGLLKEITAARFCAVGEGDVARLINLTNRASH